MASLRCKCGNALSNTNSPSGIVGYIVTDRQLDDEDDFDSCKIIEQCKDVWECPECGRLAVGNDPVVWYEPADKQYHGVCK